MAIVTNPEELKVSFLMYDCSSTRLRLGSYCLPPPPPKPISWQLFKDKAEFMTCETI